MIEISLELANALLEVPGIAIDTPMGFCSSGDNDEFIIVLDEEGRYSLAHITEYERDGFFIRFKGETKQNGHS